MRTIWDTIILSPSPRRKIIGTESVSRFWCLACSSYDNNLSKRSKIAANLNPDTETWPFYHHDSLKDQESSTQGTPQDPQISSLADHYIGDTEDPLGKNGLLWRSSLQMSRVFMAYRAFFSSTVHPNTMNDSYRTSRLGHPVVTILEHVIRKKIPFHPVRALTQPGLCMFFPPFGQTSVPTPAHSGTTYSSISEAIEPRNLAHLAWH